MKIFEYNNYKEFKNRLDSIKIDEIDESFIIDYINIIGLSGDELMDVEEIIEHLTEHIDYINNMTNPMKLYRIVSSETKDEIDLNNLGKHYTLDYMFIDTHFLMDIGIDEDSPMFVVECLIDKKYIDIPHTLVTNIKYPSENEVSILENAEIKVIDIKNYI